MQNYIDEFEKYWEQFSQQLSLSKTHQTSLYSLLFAAYTEPKRYYHTVQHIVECLSLFHKIKASLENPILVECAIWFHDVVYNAQNTDNEERSAVLMRVLLADTLDQIQLKKVYGWIIATQEHQASIEHDLNYLLDIDLAILGYDSNRFANYQMQIQQEYCWVEPHIYQIKRLEVLQYFYEMQPIYQTQYFQQHFEDKAQNNLKKTIEIMKKNIKINQG